MEPRQQRGPECVARPDGVHDLHLRRGDPHSEVAVGAKRAVCAESHDGQPHALGIMMRSYVDACLRGRLDGDIDASFEDGLAVQQGLAAVMKTSATAKAQRRL